MDRTQGVRYRPWVEQDYPPFPHSAYVLRLAQPPERRRPLRPSGKRVGSPQRPNRESEKQTTFEASCVKNAWRPQGGMRVACGAERACGMGCGRLEVMGTHLFAGAARNTPPPNPPTPYLPSKPPHNPLVVTPNTFPITRPATCPPKKPHPPPTTLPPPHTSRPYSPTPTRVVRMQNNFVVRTNEDVVVKSVWRRATKMVGRRFGKKP